jgi:two-component system cell cycle sensor histidine kinase/response regulator CckA
MVDRIQELEGEVARLRAEREELTVRLAHAGYQAQAVERSPVAVMCVSGVKGRYVFVNEAFAGMAGYSRAELLARDPYEVWLEVTHPDELEVERALVGRVARGEIDHYQLEKRVISRDGRTTWVRTELMAVRDAQGRLEAITAYFIDLHQERAAAHAREQLEAQLRQAEKLGTIGKLVGGIAHDFNNRLAIIMGYGELLRAGLPAGGPLAHHANMVLESAKGAAQLTRQLLAYSRRQVLKPEAFDLNEMVERMRRLLKSVVEDRVELSAVLGAKSQILADPGQIEQVILNLALNARDAMPKGGKLTLETADVMLMAGDQPGLAAGDYVALIVTDTGTGISGDVLPHIFEPFFTTKPIGQGTGLGLAMVQGIVHQSGGAASVESGPDRGTTFTIYLPQARDVAMPARPVAEVPPPMNTSFETVLVCDDDDDVRDLLVGILRLRAYTILTARNGRQALDVARAHPGPIHLLLTDLAMPELGGIELGAELRRLHPGLKVLYISGYSDDPDLVSAPLGVNTYFLPKPFLPGDLTRSVFSILEGETPVTVGRDSGLALAQERNGE